MKHRRLILFILSSIILLSMIGQFLGRSRSSSRGSGHRLSAPNRHSSEINPPPVEGYKNSDLKVTQLDFGGGENPTDAEDRDSPYADQPKRPAVSEPAFLPTAAQFSVGNRHFVFYHQSDPPASRIYQFKEGVAPEFENAEKIIDLGRHLYRPIFNGETLFLFETTIDLGNPDDRTSRPLTVTHVLSYTLSDPETPKKSGPAIIGGEPSDIRFAENSMLIITREEKDDEEIFAAHLFETGEGDELFEPEPIELSGPMCAYDPKAGLLITVGISGDSQTRFETLDLVNGGKMNSTIIDGVYRDCSYNPDEKLLIAYGAEGEKVNINYNRPAAPVLSYH